MTRHIPLILSLLWMTPGPSVAGDLLFIGHDATLITSTQGVRIASDPYQDGSQAGFLADYPKTVTAEAVTISHPHPDHNNRGAIGGSPVVISQAGAHVIGDVTVRVYNGREGSPKGPGMGNRITVVEVDGSKIVHLGDSGIVTDPEVLQAIDQADVVLVSIDDYVIPVPKVMEFMRDIHARTVVPTHWEGPSQLEAFLKAIPDGTRVAQSGSRLVLHPDMPVQVLVMKPDRALE